MTEKMQAKWFVTPHLRDVRGQHVRGQRDKEREGPGSTLQIVVVMLVVITTSAAAATEPPAAGPAAAQAAAPAARRVRGHHDALENKGE